MIIVAWILIAAQILVVVLLVRNQLTYKYLKSITSRWAESLETDNVDAWRYWRRRATSLNQNKMVFKFWVWPMSQFDPYAKDDVTKEKSP